MVRRVHGGASYAYGLLGCAEIVNSAAFVVSNGRVGFSFKWDWKVVYVRVNSHIQLHVDALLQVVHDPGDALHEVLPSIHQVSTGGDEYAAARRGAYVASMFSRSGTAGIWLGVAALAAMVAF